MAGQMKKDNNEGSHRRAGVTSRLPFSAFSLAVLAGTLIGMIGEVLRLPFRVSLSLAISGQLLANAMMAYRRNS
jgi:hypothetical protein